MTSLILSMLLIVTRIPANQNQKQPAHVLLAQFTSRENLGPGHLSASAMPAQGFGHPTAVLCDCPFSRGPPPRRQDSVLLSATNPGFHHCHFNGKVRTGPRIIQEQSHASFVIKTRKCLDLIMTATTFRMACE